jgi:transmembrane sensor
MDETEIKLRKLLATSEWTDEERRWMLRYLETSDNVVLRDLMFNHFKDSLQVQFPTDASSSRMLEYIHQQIGAGTTGRVIPLWVKAVAAASVIALLVIVSVLWSVHERRQTTVARTQQGNKISKDILPGSNKALLTLSDGTTILLDEAQNGRLAQQGSTRVLKLNGKLSYRPGQNPGTRMVYNSISTPRGGQYEVVLPDGTDVWLNAASSIRFPTAFTGTERRVELTGEAYFEVAKNAAMPFIVRVQQSEVRVLGTHFNIMAYNEEAYLKTTLLEGSVHVVSGRDIKTLIPGQQSRLSRNGQLVVHDDVNVEQEIAWKNGSFHFEAAGIETVMRQLARWYDVEVVYKDPPSDELFHADIRRNTNLSRALQALELTGKVHFETSGRKIIVMQ